MAIRPISSVSFSNGYNQVSFDGKKNKHNDGSMQRHTTAPLKAVPLAVMLAMSPLNNVEANSLSIEATQSFPEKVVLNGQVSNATKTGEECYVSFISNDGNDDDAEKVMISFIDRQRDVKQINGRKVALDYKITSRMCADTLEVVNATKRYANRPDEYFKEYYVIGPCDVTISPGVSADGNKYGIENVKKYRPLRKAVTKEFYELLKEGMEDNIQYKETNKVYDGDAENELEMYFGR